jgi:uncharacterized phage protein (TIGR01671 family)
MKREIDFRGKSIIDKKWIYGFLSYSDNEDVYYIGVQELMTPVITESVGQYTVLKDKNGKKIFEGDVVQITGVSLGEPYTFSSEIIWGQKGSWHPSGTYCENLSEYITSISGKNNSTVIGNIHEHPELLKS